MKNALILLTNDEIKQIVGGEKNETVVSEVNTDFQLMEHPWILGGIIAVVSVFFVSLNVYCCYKLMSQGGYTRDRSWEEGYRCDSVFLRKHSGYIGA